MTKPIAIKATFHTARPVPSRGVVSFVFDVPVEQATAALELLGGFPNGGESVWVGIAPLVAKPADEARKPDARERYAQATEGEQAVTRAALLCNEDSFIGFIGCETPEGAANRLRSKLGIESRKELATNPDALARFLDIEKQYQDVRQFGPHAGRH